MKDVQVGEERSVRRLASGQATVEFAIGMVLLFTIICGIFEFAWVFYNYSFLNNTVSVAARKASVGATTAVTIAAVQNSAGGIPITTVTVAVATPAGASVASSDRTTGNFLTVSASVSYSNLTPLSRMVSSSSFGQLRVASTVRIE